MKATRKFINSQDKVPSQNLVKRWTQTINVPSSQDEDDSNKLTLLTITGQDAIYCKMADKIAGNGWIAKWLVKAQLHTMVDSLDKYEDDLADLMRKHVDADEKSKLVVDYMQDWLRKQCAKIFKK